MMKMMSCMHQYTIFSLIHIYQNTQRANNASLRQYTSKCFNTCHRQIKGSLLTLQHLVRDKSCVLCTSDLTTKPSLHGLAHKR